MMAARIVGVVLFLALAGCGDDSPKDSHAGHAMPPFSARTLSGEQLDLPAAADGKVLILSFWATWCVFCKAEMMALEPVWLEKQREGVLVLAVNLGQRPEEIRKFVSDLEVTYPILLDPQTNISRNFGITGLPTTFIIDRQGRIQKRILGKPDDLTLRKILGEMQ